MGSEKSKGTRELLGGILRLRVRRYAVLIVAEEDPGYTYLEHMLYPEIYMDYGKNGLKVEELLEHVVGETLDNRIKRIKILVETRKGAYLFEASKGKIRLVASL